jgi:hypothetical protein
MLIVRFTLRRSCNQSSSTVTYSPKYANCLCSN